MRRGRRPKLHSSRPPPQRGEPDLPALTELERFSQASLHQWLAAKSYLDTLQRALYFELEPLRQRNESRLRDALLSQTLSSFEFDGWSRIVDYRYGLEPLSVAGSLKGEGGRFNIGGELSPAAFTAFPALYVAEDYETAFRERFAGPSSAKPGGLSAQEFALAVTWLLHAGSPTWSHRESARHRQSRDLESIRECPSGIPDSARRTAVGRSAWAKWEETIMMRLVGFITV